MTDVPKDCVQYRHRLRITAQRLCPTCQGHGGQGDGFVAGPDDKVRSDWYLCDCVTLELEPLGEHEPMEIRVTGYSNNEDAKGWVPDILVKRKDAPHDEPVA